LIYQVLDIGEERRRRAGYFIGIKPAFRNSDLNSKIKVKKFI
jgi:hypothetical protein